MCLVIDQNFHKDLKPKIAEKNIVCYKILKVVDKKLCAPYDHNDNEIDIKKEYISDAFEIYPTKNLDVSDYYEEFMVPAIFPEINHAIHTYCNKPIKNKNIKFSKEKYKVFECIIPKGTLYWKGEGTYSIPTYASEKIKFIKDISKEL